MTADRFPIPAPPFGARSRRVGPGNAFAWLRQGWAIYVVNPAAWSAMTMILIVIYLGLAIVPWIGQLAAHLLSPILAAGMLLAARKAVEGQALSASDVFAGFERSTSPLATLGLAYLAAMLLVVGVALLFAGGGVAGGLAIGSATGITLALSGILLAGGSWLALSLPVLMALWFAPALVVFNEVPPARALAASFTACLKNTFVLLVYALIVLVLAFLAALPFGLGFLVLGPVVAGSMYASYRDIFIHA
ncbi:BPSS1780 family membrane protein [Accumulibacter sp.]|uniref:BPSS1780 family membrane protein n=1 Tax=Accumulibacter sp. TaxID=2053492 RepID=UPI0025FFA2AA|nr:BPSS1780 family membrane protein [Accumulibacter sp.]MDS4048078.1 BPSS1780 family membrane protein [Accumulibacter sp.]